MIRWAIAWALACAAIFSLVFWQHEMIEAQAQAIARYEDTLYLEQDALSVCLATLTDCRNELYMTHEEALIAMTKLWLEAEAKLKNSVPLDEVEKLRVDLVSLAPAALQGPVDEFFARLKKH